MTTIAYRAGILAADSQGTRSGSRIRIKKLRRLPDGSLFAGAGHTGAIVKVQRWCEAGMPEGKLPKLALAEDEEVECLLIKTDGTILLIDESLAPEPLEQEFMSIGTGCEYAIAYMDKGCTAAEAVDLTSKWDTNTSGPVDTMALVIPSQPAT